MKYRFIILAVAISLNSAPLSSQIRQSTAGTLPDGVADIRLPPELKLPSELQLPPELRLPPEFEGTPYWEEDQSPPEEIQEVIEEFPEIFRDFKTADPIGDPQELVNTNAYHTYAELCEERGGAFCRRQAWLDSASSYLLDGAARNPGCKPAVEEFLPFYQRGNPPPEVAREYDIACLGGLILRDGEVTPAQRPDVLNGAELAGGLLSAIGLVIRSGKPVCAGLLLPNRRFVTAKHCDEYMGAEPSVYQASSGLTWQLAEPNLNDSDGVSNDWAIYGVQADDDYRVAAVTSASSSEPIPATVLAGYPFNQAFQANAANALEAMRFPRDGLCHTVFLREGCLQLICQTVGGFSGAPVFRANSSPDSPELLGFVSGSLGNDTGCNVLPISSSTLAVAATEIGGEF